MLGADIEHIGFAVLAAVKLTCLHKIEKIGLCGRVQYTRSTKPYVALLAAQGSRRVIVVVVMVVMVVVMVVVEATAAGRIPLG